MTDRRLALITLFMLLLSGWSIGVTSASNLNSQIDSEYDEMEEADSIFKPFSSASSSTHQIKQSSGFIHSPYGSFDPIQHPIPLGPENIVDLHALDRTRFALVQSNSADLTSLHQNLQDKGMVVIETIPDDTLIIKIPIQFNSAKTLLELSSMDGVRWAGELPIAWRVSSQVASIAGRDTITVDLDITPAPDLTDIQLKQLQSDLESVSEIAITSPLPFRVLAESTRAWLIPAMSLATELWIVNFEA